MRFTEIEHKFVVGDDFDLTAFDRALEDLGPRHRSALEVRDRYFLTADGRARGYVLRHRYDAEIHELTLKSVVDDAEVRDEITLDLARTDGDQAAAVDALIGKMDVVWSGTLVKNLRVWYFPDCEAVHYTASTDGRRVHCVEFEAIVKRSREEAVEILTRYERATGLDAAARSKYSIVDLLFPGVLTR